MGATNGKFKTLHFFFLFWEIWCARNRLIFQGKPTNISLIHGSIMSWLAGRPSHQVIPRDLSLHTWPHPISILVIYFDGAQQHGICGCGAWIKLIEA